MTLKYFLFDCETGGYQDKDVSLLTLYGLILDKDLNILDEIDLSICPNDGIYRIQPGALAKNNISIVEHDKVAIAQSRASDILQIFLLKHIGLDSRLIPAGHNVSYDIAFAKKLIAPGHWEGLFSNKSLDTASIARFLYLGKQINLENPSLENLANYFNVPYVNSHTAKGDVLITLEVLKKMLKLLPST